MSSAVDIQIVSQRNLAKLESFFKDSSYQETIELGANFNTRLCIERRLRLPFFDPQTGVAQNHSQLFVNKRNRMPGFKQGQIYTYPAHRWRKSRRQYLNKTFSDRPFQDLRSKEHEALNISTTSMSGTASPTASYMPTHDAEFNGSFLDESSSLGPLGGDTSDSNSQQQQHLHYHQQQHLKDDLSKEWFYDDMDINDVDSLEDPKSPADDEYDYDPRYGTKKRRKRRGGKKAIMTPGELCGPGRRRSGAGRGRAPANEHSFSMDSLDASSLSSDLLSTPTSSTNNSSFGSMGRRPRGTGTRGRRRAKLNNSMGVCDPPSPGITSEPPSFESVAALVGVGVGVGGSNDVNERHHHHHQQHEQHHVGDIRNYRKYL